MSDRTTAWPEAAVFDFDGLLVDTARCWRAAYAASLAGADAGLARAQSSSLAGASVAGAAAVLGVPSAVLRANLVAAFERTPLTPLPGARELVTSLRGRAPLAVATNGPEEVVVAALRDLGFLPHLEFVLSAETQAAEEPAPDVYRAACARLGADPRRSIAFEDSPIGAVAARRAGLAVVYVPSDGQPADADLTVETLADSRLLALLERRA
jgi:HAD superfamily hydrolase (TIGR01509 family)